MRTAGFQTKHKNIFFPSLPDYCFAFLFLNSFQIVTMTVFCMSTENAGLQAPVRQNASAMMEKFDVHWSSVQNWAAVIP